MSKAARITLSAAVLFATGTICGVHYMQLSEREVSLLRFRVSPLDVFLTLNGTHTSQTMYKGVIRDDERRAAKMRQREEEHQESMRKRELYERVQPVNTNGR
ncbi:hypothetical protein EW145_g1393 [Phellinidium pouzarii]|uniref:Cytochrome c oxidase assembly protein COX16, mitochondrial n=1 Tax=Phellinidium pouzarii TaxID=167371 RepID=A0A4V3XDM7_9AGAM|nr:hypothetical protein EW145_g1393 [Phellinidium pouzarii]